MKTKAQIAAFICGASMSAMASAMAPLHPAFNETLSDGGIFSEGVSYSAGMYFEDTWNVELTESMGVAGLSSDLQTGSLQAISGSSDQDMAVEPWGGSHVLSVSSAHVPEPQNWAILLVGIGLLALRMRELISQAKPHLG